MATQANEPQADDLVTLGRGRFGDLSAAEAKLLEAAPKGGLAVCGPNDDWDDAANDPANADKWKADREIRAGLVRGFAWTAWPESEWTRRGFKSSEQELPGN